MFIFYCNNGKIFLIEESFLVFDQCIAEGSVNLDLMRDIL